MTVREIVLARGALRALSGAGSSGLGADALAEQAGTFAETILSHLERTWLERTLLSRGWAERRTDPLTGNARLTLTERGNLALGAL